MPWAEVAGIRCAIPVRIQCIVTVWAVVTHVAQSIYVAIGLIGIGVIGAVVAAIGVRVAVDVVAVEGAVVTVRSAA